MLQKQGFHIVEGPGMLGKTSIGDLRFPANVSRSSSLPFKAVAMVIDGFAGMDPFDILCNKRELASDYEDSPTNGVAVITSVAVTDKKRITFPLCGRNDEEGSIGKNLVEHCASGARNPHVRSRATFGVKHSGFFGTVRIR